MVEKLAVAAAHVQNGILLGDPPLEELPDQHFPYGRLRLAVFRVEPQAIQLLAFGWQRLHSDTVAKHHYCRLPIAIRHAAITHVSAVCLDARPARR